MNISDIDLASHPVIQDLLSRIEKLEFQLRTEHEKLEKLEHEHVHDHQLIEKLDHKQPYSPPRPRVAVGL